MYSKSNIYYEIKNVDKQETLVLLHGNGEDHHIYDDFINSFNDYKIILIDSRLHGKSKKDETKVYLETLVSDIQEILKENNITKASFVGFSDGGNLCLLLALNEPSLIDKMVVMGANYNQFGLKFPYLLLNYLTYGLYSVLGLFSKHFRLKKYIYRLMTREPNLTDLEVSKIKTKTLIITSKKDCIRLKHSQRMNALIKDSKLVLIPNSSHYFLKDNLNETIKQIALYFR